MGINKKTHCLQNGDNFYIEAETPSITKILKSKHRPTKLEILKSKHRPTKSKILKSKHRPTKSKIL
jgi:hypothetical protein